MVINTCGGDLSSFHHRLASFIVHLVGSDSYAADGSVAIALSRPLYEETFQTDDKMHKLNMTGKITNVGKKIFAKARKG